MTNNTTVNIKDGWSSLRNYILYGFEGLVIWIPNFIIVITVLRFAALRKTKEYLMVMGQALADSLHMFGYFLAGVRRSTLVLSGQHSQFKTQWQCALTSHNIVLALSMPISGLMLLVISIDRWLAVSRPIKYVSWSYKYALVMLSFAYGYCFFTGLLLNLAMVYSASSEKSVMILAKCLSVSILPDGNHYYVAYSYYYLYSPVVFSLLSILGYGPVWLTLKKHQLKVNPTAGTVNRGQKKAMNQQRRITVSLGISCMCTLFVYMIPYTVGRYSLGIIPNGIRLFLFVLSNFNPFFNVFIYAFRHPEMKNAIVALFTNKQMPNKLALWEANRVAKANQKKKQMVNESKL